MQVMLNFEVAKWENVWRLLLFSEGKRAAAANTESITARLRRIKNAYRCTPSIGAGEASTAIRYVQAPLHSR